MGSGCVAANSHPALKLEQIEKRHPGLTSVDRAEDGRFVLQELGDDEVAKIMKGCRIEIPKDE